MSKQLQHVVFQNRYPKRRLSVIHDHKDYAIDQHAFQLATRWHCIKNKLCHHVAVTNNTPSLYSKQSSLLSFLCIALQWQSVRRASPCTSSQVVNRVHFVVDHRQKYYHRNSRDVGDRGESEQLFLDKKPYLGRCYQTNLVPMSRANFSVVQLC